MRLKRNISIVKILIILSIFLVGNNTSAYSAKIEFSGASLKVLNIAAEKNTGLNDIYVAYSLKDVSAKFASTNPSAVKWYQYSNLGGGFAVEIRGVSYDGQYSILPQITGDMGYIIEDNNDRYYFWVVDYEPQRFSIRNVTPAADRDCDYTKLLVEGSGTPIHYFTINGQQKVLSRDITVEYENEVWDEESKVFVKESQTKVLESLQPEINIPAVLCSSYFTISGDRFLKEWNWLQTAESSVVQPIAVQVHATAEQERNNDEQSNQMRSDDSTLGGSAPATISFKAITSEGVLHDEWQMSRTPDFENVEYRFSVKDLDYTFNEEGTYYLRYVGSNSDGSCDSYSDTFTVSIGASSLKCPNAFSPDGDGVNDEWKVSYRSIIEFKCWIFDRQGRQIYYFDSPDKGWDGKYHGKLVNPGVYFYVITAKGADGKKYKESGDINIIRRKTTGNITN